MNSMNLNNNYDEIIRDQNLMESKLLVLSETWLEEKDIFNINGYKSHFNNVGPGKGLALYYKNEKITQWLENNQFSQLMREATHIKGRLLDHFYFKPSGNTSQNPSMHRYSPYYADHDAIYATITMKGSF